MAHHDILLSLVAAVSHGSKQGFCCLDAAVRIQSFTLEQAVFVVALVRCASAVVLGARHILFRSISVDVQYFVFAVIALLICSMVPSRATVLLTALAAAAAAASVILSIQTASELINAPAGSELRLPMPVIGIDWMQVLRAAAAASFPHTSFPHTRFTRSPAP